MKRSLLSSVAIVLTLTAVPVSGYSADLPAMSAPARLNEEQTALSTILTKGSAQGVPFEYPKGLRDFYKTRNYETFWTARGKVGKKADQALDILEDSWSHGLSPAVYNTKLLRSMEKSRLKPQQALEFEALLSDAVARYGHDITGMRINPASIGEDTRSWARGIDAPSLLNYVMSDGDVKGSLQKLAPSSRLYAALRTELKKLINDVAEHPDADRPALKYRNAIYPGDSSPSIPLIRTRLGLSEKGADNTLYDPALAKVVSRFQSANGLKADGIIGKRTYNAINQTRKDKLIKVLANLERQRWLDQRFPNRYIVVNVPAMTLWAIEDGDIKYEMPVVVGRQARATNSFVTDIVGIRFNPSWNVPDTIKTEDFLPALQKDPEALKKKGIELIRYTPDGVENIAPQSIDWSTMTPQTIKALGMVQNPGDDNALGRIRVLMPNKYDIYLHDTNSPDLFARDYRALSSGCIRVSDPRKIAKFILGQNKGWSDSRIDAYLEKTKTVEIRADHKLPVFILYQTVWFNDQGQLVYGDDLYGNDAKLVRELQRTGQLSLPAGFK